MDKNPEYWDEAYKKGVHWEEGHSVGAERFSKMLKTGSRLLDIGCGSGRDCIFFAKQDFDVTGVDVSEEAIKKAKQAAEKQNLKISFEVMNSENLACESESFDAAFASTSLQFTDLEKSAQEIYRILKKGAVCFFVDILSTIDLSGKESKRKYSLGQIISAFRKFAIIKREEFEKADEKPEPHKHKFLALMLKKE